MLKGIFQMFALSAVLVLAGCATPQSGTLCCETANSCSDGPTSDIEKAVMACAAKGGSSYTSPTMSCKENVCSSN